MRPINIIYCFVTALLLLLTGCATTPMPHSTDRDQPTQPVNASALYTAGKEAMGNGNPQESIHHFNTLITQYPVNEITLQGRLELAYAYHKDGQTSAAIATTERFINQHPQHKNIDYAYYLRGLTSYEAAVARLNEGITTDTAITGAPYEAHMALEFLHELMHHFPNGKFSGDTQQRINDLDDRMAQYLIIAAEEQLDRGNLAKAGLLAKAVVEEHPDSSSIQKAAIITNQAYQLLGINSDNQHNVALAPMQTALKSDAQPAAITPPVVSHVTNAPADVVESASVSVPAPLPVPVSVPVPVPAPAPVSVPAPAPANAEAEAEAEAIVTSIELENETVSRPLNRNAPKEMATVATPEPLIPAPDIINISKKLSRHHNTQWHSHSSTYRLYLGGHLNAEYSQEKDLLTIREDNNGGGLTCKYSTRDGELTNAEQDKMTACNTLAGKLQTYLKNN